MGDWPTIKCRGNCFFKVMTRGLRALLSYRDISIINAAMVYLAHAAIGYSKHRGFRRRCDVSHVYKGLRSIKYCISVNGKLALMPLHNIPCVLRIRKNPPEHDVPRG